MASKSDHERNKLHIQTQTNDTTQCTELDDQTQEDEQNLASSDQRRNSKYKSSIKHEECKVKFREECKVKAGIPHPSATQKIEKVFKSADRCIDRQVSRYLN